jgi:hypothetical protein
MSIDFRDFAAQLEQRDVRALVSIDPLTHERLSVPRDRACHRHGVRVGCELLDPLLGVAHALPDIDPRAESMPPIPRGSDAVGSYPQSNGWSSECVTRSGVPIRTRRYTCSVPKARPRSMPYRMRSGISDHGLGAEGEVDRLPLRVPLAQQGFVPRGALLLSRAVLSSASGNRAPSARARLASGSRHSMQATSHAEIDPHLLKLICRRDRLDRRRPALPREQAAIGGAQGRRPARTWTALSVVMATIVTATSAATI